MSVGYSSPNSSNQFQPLGFYTDQGSTYIDATSPALYATPIAAAELAANTAFASNPYYHVTNSQIADNSYPNNGVGLSTDQIAAINQARMKASGNGGLLQSLSTGYSDLNKSLFGTDKITSGADVANAASTFLFGVSAQDVVIVTIAIILLAIAAFSLIVPPGQRSRFIATLAGG